jgi:adenylate cyclase
MQRRLAAILAADVVGYSRMMAFDEKGTHARLKALRKDFIEPKIAEHHGRIVKLTGDGALVEFASVVDAVECAAAIQTGVVEHQIDQPVDRRIVFRIGINIGDIIIEADDIYGDGVNVAVRLEGLARPGGICVSRTVYNHVRNKVELAFEPARQHHVKNIPEPITVYHLRLDGASTRAVPTVGSLRRWWVGAVIAVLVLGTIGAAAWLRPWVAESGSATQARNGPPIVDKSSIAVLPFDNLSGDPAQEYFSDGITEDLITALSMISGLSVVTRTATFQYKSQIQDPQQIARDLAVHYVLDGGVHKEEKRILINARLINGATGYNQWSERFDRDISELFALQNEIKEKVVVALRINITEMERNLLSQRFTNDVEAYELYLHGISLYRQKQRQAVYQARRLLQRAIDLDPRFSKAHARLAHTYFYAFEAGWEGPASLNHAVELAQKAVALDDLRDALLPE